MFESNKFVAQIDRHKHTLQNTFDMLLKIIIYFYFVFANYDPRTRGPSERLLTVPREEQTLVL